jgi:retron-type reverse transcriptase
MTKASIDLRDLRRRLYVKAKAETSWRFWGLYVHVCKLETLRAAYALAQKNDGAPGVDGVTFAAIEEQGVEAFLVQLRDELVGRTYVPLPARRQEIPKDGGKVRVLSIPAIRDRVVQGALKLILEPIFEADFQPGSFGYRPKRTAHEAVDRVAKAIVQHKTRVIDIDLRSYLGVWPSKAWRRRITVTSAGTSRRWVVWRLFLRCHVPHVDTPLPRAPDRGQAHPSPDQEMAEGRRCRRWTRGTQ